jgi:nitric oxide reductase activation protein
VATQPGTQRIGQESDPIPRDIAARMEKERRKERYENLKRDSEKLLELATELKQYVDKSGDNVLSLEVIRKCEEIEKLSKSVRTKMKGD